MTAAEKLNIARLLTQSVQTGRPIEARATNESVWYKTECIVVEGYEHRLQPEVEMDPFEQWWNDVYTRPWDSSRDIAKDAWDAALEIMT